MDELGPFGYLVSEAEESFFQETADEIAKTAAKTTAMGRFVKSRTVKQLSAAARKRKPKLKPVKAPKAKKLTESQRKQILAAAGAADKPSKAVEDALAYARRGGFMGHGSKLAMLVYQSTEAELCKEADVGLVSGSFSTYPDLLNAVAAASFFEPMGMSKTACDYIEGLDKIGIDLGPVSVPLIIHALQTDVVIEAALEKTAGSEAELGELCTELEKLALSTLALRGISSMGRAAKAVGRAAKAVGTAPVKAVRAIREAGGIRAAAGAAARRVTTPVAAKARGILSGAREKSLSRIKSKVESLRSQRTDLQKQLGAATTAQKRSNLRTRIESIQKSLLPILKREGQLTAKLKASSGRAVAKAKASAAKGAKKARKAAKAPVLGIPKIKTKKPRMPKSPAVGETIKVEAFRRYEKAKEAGILRKDAVAPPGYSEWVQKGRPSAKHIPPQPKGGKPAAAPTKAPVPATPTGAERISRARRPGPGAPSPQSPPKGTTPADLPETGTLGQIKDKWSAGGWKALSDAEKRKVYVAAGAVFVGQRVLMDKPII